MADPTGRDPLEELTRLGAGLGAGTPGGPMTHTAADARRRGDRLRRRRTALVAGGAALAVAAVAVPLGLLAADGKPRADRDLVATNPPELTEAALLTDDQTVHSDGADWFATDTPDPAARLALDVCGRDDVVGLGAGSVLQRDFEMQIINDPEVDVSGERLRHTVAEFDDAEAARSAYQSIRTWLEECEDRAGAQGLSEHRFQQTYDVDVTAAGPTASGVIIDHHFGPLPPELDDGYSAYISETGVALVDNRIAVLDLVVVGQDYNFSTEDGGTPVNRMLTVAAELLAVDASPSPNDPDSSTSAAAFPTGLELDAGWRDEEAPYELGLPSTTMAGLFDDQGALPCHGGEPPAMADSQRQTVRLAGPTQSYGREVWLFATEEEAKAALEGIVDPFVGCGLDATVSSTTFDVTTDAAGDDARRIIGVTSYSDDALEADLVAESTRVWWLGRFGTAVFVMTATEQGGGTAAAGNALLDSLVADAEPVLAQLADLG